MPRAPKAALVTCLAGALLSTPAHALDPGRALKQLYHVAWRATDGAPSQISALAQTEDGYLWIGSARGLFRFDGVRFELYEPPPGASLPSHNIYTLMATPDGGLWISFRPSGLAFLKDGHLTVFTRPEELPQSQVYSFARDHDGRIWAGTHTGLAMLDGSRWVPVGRDWSFTPERIWTLFVDRDGTLWVATDETIVFLPRGVKTFQPTGTRLGGAVHNIAQARDGRLWMAENSRARPIPVAGRDAAAEDPELRVEAHRLLIDRDGSFWIGYSDGLRRVRFPERLGNRKVEPDDMAFESFGDSGALTGPVLEDREGNIWFGTLKGLEGFRYSHLVPVSLPPGHRSSTLLAGDDGEVWVGSATPYPVVRVRGEEVIVASGAPKTACVYRDRRGDVWWGGFAGIWRQRGDRFDHYPQPHDTTDQWIWELISDDDGAGLWAGLDDTGFIHFKDGRWTNRPRPAGLPEPPPSATYHDPSGRIWLGYTENRVFVLDGTRVTAYSREDGIDIGRIRVIRGRGPHFWLGGELGLAIFSAGRFRTIRTTGGEQFGTVTGIVETREGALWLNEMRGVARISAEEVRQVVANPKHPLSYQRFDFLDGLPGAVQMNFAASTAIEASDGRLWFATENGLVTIDPARLVMNAVPPPVTILSISSDEARYRPSDAVTFAPGTQRVEIAYTALSLSIPERVRFRYQLVGHDTDWVEPGTRRQAFYTGLGPGDYQFRVIACNNDGVWNVIGAALRFSIAPAWYQTSWFRGLSLFCGLFVAWSVYRLRLRQVAGIMSARFDERLAERTRIARDLHDTFLQTVQGSKLVADQALETSSDPVSMRRALEQLSGWLARAIHEGRAALNSLRASTTQTNDLAEALERATENGLHPALMAIRFSVLGEPRAMHPIVRDEVYRIGYEAIGNARAHSSARQLIVELSYGHDLTLRVSDDGIGIDPVVVDKGMEGHFGLPGMRERAHRIEGQLTIVSSSHGTEIKLVVPGGMIFRSSRTGS